MQNDVNDFCPFLFYTLPVLEKCSLEIMSGDVTNTSHDWFTTMINTCRPSVLCEHPTTIHKHTSPVINVSTASHQVKV